MSGGDGSECLLTGQSSGSKTWFTDRRQRDPLHSHDTGSPLQKVRDRGLLEAIPDPGNDRRDRIGAVSCLGPDRCGHVSPLHEVDPGAFGG